MVGQLFPPSPETTIIDVGCGTGANLASLTGEYRCVGIDTSADAIRLAQERFPQTEFILGRAPDDLGKTIGEARMVLMMDVLEHVPDDFSLFSAVAAAVRPSTYLLITVPADLRLWSGHDESFGHYRRYDARRLAKIWEGLHIEPVMVSYFNRRLHPVIKSMRTWNRWRGAGKVSGRAGTDFALPPTGMNRLLENIFAGESRTLCRTLKTGRGGYRKGVSLMAVLRRLDGHFDEREKPASIEPDYFDPAAAASRAQIA